MRTLVRLACTTAAAIALSGALSGSAIAQTGGGANNLVQIVNTTDHTLAARGKVQAAPYAGSSAQSTNLARADSRDCTGCRSQAAALQAVFLTGDTSTVQVTNAAVATNSACTSCTAYAYAYQYVIITERAVSLSPTGQQRLRDIAVQVSRTIAEPGSTVEDFLALDARLDELAAQLRAVVDHELRTGRHNATTRSDRDRALS